MHLSLYLNVFYNIVLHFSLYILLLFSVDLCKVFWILLFISKPLKVTWHFYSSFLSSRQQQTWTLWTFAFISPLNSGYIGHLTRNHLCADYKQSYLLCLPNTAIVAVLLIPWKKLFCPLLNSLDISIHLQFEFFYCAAVGKIGCFWQQEWKGWIKNLAAFSRQQPFNCAYWKN